MKVQREMRDKANRLQALQAKYNTLEQVHVHSIIICTVDPPKMDSPYYGNLHSVDKRPWFQIIAYSLLYIVTSA